MFPPYLAVPRYRNSVIAADEPKVEPRAIVVEIAEPSSLPSKPPSSAAKENGHYRLGLFAQPVNDEQRKTLHVKAEYGLRIGKIFGSNSPADKAGLKSTTRLPRAAGDRTLATVDDFVVKGRSTGKPVDWFSVDAKSKVSPSLQIFGPMIPCMSSSSRKCCCG